MSTPDPWWERPLAGCLEPLLKVVGALAVWVFVRSMRRYRDEHPDPSATDDETEATAPTRC